MVWFFIRLSLCKPHSTRIWDALHAAIAKQIPPRAWLIIRFTRSAPHTGTIENERRASQLKIHNQKILRYRIYTIGTQVIVTLADRSLKRFLLDIKFLNAQSDQTCH